MKRQRPFLGRRPLIMLLLALLVALFCGGMWLLSTLNLRFAEGALSELRERQIVDTFHANLDRIDAHHRRMEQNSRGLARAGVLLTEMETGEARVSEALEQALEEFPDARGATLWLTRLSPPAAMFARREGPRVVVEPLEAGWAQAEWLQTRLAGWREGNGQPHWTATYFKPRIDDAVISVSTPVRDAAGRVLGMAASDWVADDIIGLVSDVQVTPSTFAFLVDRENRNLSSLARAEDQQRAQRLIEAVSALALHQDAGELAALKGMVRRDLDLGGEPWSLYHDATRAGMVFGIAVPQAEIDAVLTPMREVNLQLLVGIGLVLLLLAGMILFLVAGLLRQLRTLYTDPLTRLPNRARLLADLEAGRAGSLMLVNVDGFKQINDLFGHRCGDRVIQRLAERLEELLKASGWRDCRLYRMPGDEQAVWLPGTVADAALQATVETLYQALSGLRLDWRGQELPLQMTLGVASSWQLENGPDGDETLLSSANIALKQARAAQRPYAFYDPATRVRRDYERNLAWANRLAEALDDGRVVAYFQPILEVASGRVGKFECLVRMLDEEGEPVSPGVFLEVARRSRLYRRLTLTMIDRCLAALAESPHEFSLNLSGEDIVDAAISEALLARVAESGVGERLIFEILESEGIDNYAAVSAFIDRAKALGVRIAIDDFGSGYSNFEHLLRLDVDLLKIDGSLVRQLDTDPGAETLIRGIVGFARELGITTVAEFVHSEAVLARVRALGVDFAQGACIGMPGPHPEFEAAVGEGRANPVD
ncbi:EAL domain-containing protein [Halomonas sp. SSL-5]|uniref:EAL domain-containing protein n=1 Tax=Halomonas sp. SSL-5 TaxID=3065855 RepID=UPI0027381860|nr:EAL domain-containing protein [Halomonas sp. SSL-5]MDY7115781.1 EAL domain-containing protein [Halomonas sp. SSL-5]